MGTSSGSTLPDIPPLRSVTISTACKVTQQTKSLHCFFIVFSVTNVLACSKLSDSRDGMKIRKGTPK